MIIGNFEFASILAWLAFLAAILISGIWSFFIVYHLLKFGIDFKTKVLAAVFVIGFAVFLGSSFLLFLKIGWPELINEYLTIPKTL